MSEDDAASKWGIKEYVFALAGLVLILFVAGLVKWENGSVALTDRSEDFIERVTAGDQHEWAPETLPEGWVKNSGTGYSYGMPDSWYFAEPKDKFEFAAKRTADSVAMNAETVDDASATFLVLKTSSSDFDDFDDEVYAKQVGKSWTGKYTWSEMELDGKAAWSFKGKVEVDGVTVPARRVLVPEEGIFIDMKYHEGSGTKNTLEKVFRTWTWEE